MKEMNPRVAFGQGIRALREARGLTQAQLAERSDLQSWKYIGTVENARTNITLTNIIRLAQGLGLSSAELMNACFPDDKSRKDLLHELLALVAKKDEKTIQLTLGILAEVKKAGD